MSAGQSKTQKPSEGKLSPWQQAFLQRHQLDATYLDGAQKWFTSLVQALALHRNSAGRPILVAVNGSQGSGKTTVCDWLCASLQAQHGLRALALSLDDFYLTAAERNYLAGSVHPLLATRGVPGTHDMNLLQATLDVLEESTVGAEVIVPRFDKSQDDRKPASEWDEISGGVDVILLEGWCLGATAQNPDELLEPVNSLEQKEDPDGSWRRYVNDALGRDFPPLYDRADLWVMLQAPSFDCVYRWRLEQEEKLARRVAEDSAGLMSAAQIGRFIQYYQRLTERCLTDLPGRVDFLYRLDPSRQVCSFEQRKGPKQ